MRKDDLMAASANASSDEKIRLLETLVDACEPNTISGIISMLDDSDIRVRGEAFSTLILNKNSISDTLTKSLDSPSEYVRGFVALILANRRERGIIPEIVRRAHDPSSMVRSCVAGALGFLDAHDAKDVIHRLIQDSSMEVRRSALQAIFRMNDSISDYEADAISKDSDSEIEMILAMTHRH